MKQLKKCVICGTLHRNKSACSIECRSKLDSITKSGVKNPAHSKAMKEKYRNGYKNWNAGLTKETDERVKKNAKALTGIKKDFSNYNGRKHHLFTTGFGLYREESVKLLGYNCQECGSAKFVDTHHIDSNNRNNPKDGSNWMRLCRKCHKKIHRNLIH